MPVDRACLRLIIFVTMGLVACHSGGPDDSDNAASVIDSGGSGDRGGPEIVNCNAPRPLASISIDPVQWTESSRIGQRQKLTATAYDEEGNENPCGKITWTSLSNSVTVDDGGLVTAVRRGTAEIVAEGIQVCIREAPGQCPESDKPRDEIQLTINSAVPSDRDVAMLTVWTARSFEGAAALVDGDLKVIRLSGYDQGGAWPLSADEMRPWHQDGVAKYQWQGDRIAILSDVVDGAGTLRTLDRHREWQVVSVGDVVDFQLYDSGIARLNDRGHLIFPRLNFVIPGFIDVGPTPVADVVEFQIEGNRVAVLSSAGQLAHGTIAEVAPLFGEPELHDVAIDNSLLVREFKLTPNGLIVLLREDGVLGVYDVFTDAWKALATGETDITSFEVEQWSENGSVILGPILGRPGRYVTRIAVVGNDGSLRVHDVIKEFTSNSWQVSGPGTLLETAGVAKVALDGRLIVQGSDVIAVYYSDGRLRLKRGLEGEWFDVASDGVKTFSLTPGLLGLVRDDGAVDLLDTTALNLGCCDRRWIDGIDSIIGDSVSQLTPLVAIPDPPMRTISVSLGGERVPASGLYGRVRSYPDEQSECKKDDSRGWHCAWVSEWALPVAWYGRWCGYDVPESKGEPDDPDDPDNPGTKLTDLQWARRVGSIDSFDYLCRNHDNADGYYGGPENDWWQDSNGDSIFDECVVRYGIEHALLTVEGEVVRRDVAEWHSAWSGMSNLWDAISNYDWYTVGCGPAELSEFEEFTSNG